MMEKIAGSEFYKSIIQEEANQTIEERKEAAASIRILDQESLKTHRDLHAKISKKEKELKAIED